MEDGDLKDLHDEDEADWWKKSDWRIEWFTVLKTIELLRPAA